MALVSSIYTRGNSIYNVRAECIGGKAKVGATKKARAKRHAKQKANRQSLLAQIDRIRDLK